MATAKQTQLDDDLYILGLEEDPGEDLIHDILTLEDMHWWNEWYKDNGFPQAVNLDYGDLNSMAKALGIPYNSMGETMPQNMAQPLPPSLPPQPLAPPEETGASNG